MQFAIVRILAFTLIYLPKELKKVAKNWDRRGKGERERERERDKELNDQQNTEHDGVVAVCVSLSHKHFFALFANKENV